MNKLVKVFGISALSLASIVNGCEQNKANKKSDYLEVSGIVVDERYMLASGGWNKVNSKYSFSFDTKYGRKVIEIFDDYANKESIDALIQPGIKIEFLIDKEDSAKVVYNLGASEFIKLIKK